MNPEKFRLYRMRKGYSQKQLAEILEIGRSYMNQIERGKVTPSMTLLNKIANTLGKNIKDFF